MAVIYQKDFTADGTQSYMLMSGEEYIRPLGIGTNWTTLRVTISCAIKSNGSTLDIVAAGMVMGVCSGLRGWGDQNTTHALGLAWTQSNLSLVPSAWTYTANSGNPYYNTAGFYLHVRKIGGTIDIPGSGYAGPNSYMPVSDQGNVRKGVLGFNIVKAAGSVFQGRGIEAALNNATLNFKHVDLVTIHEAIGYLSVETSQGDVLFDSLNAGSYPVIDEATYGYFDTFFLYWPKTTHQLEVYSIMISRQA